MFRVYILYSEGHDKYYIGQTSNLEERLQAHNSGKSTYTSRYLPWVLLGSIEKPNRSEAMKLEKKLKNLGKERLRKFIEKYG